MRSYVSHTHNETPTQVLGWARVHGHRKKTFICQKYNRNEKGWSKVKETPKTSISTIDHQTDSKHILYQKIKISIHSCICLPTTQPLKNLPKVRKAKKRGTCTRALTQTTNFLLRFLAEMHHSMF